MDVAVNIVEVIYYLFYIADVDQEMLWVKILKHVITSQFFKGTIS